MTDPAAIKGTYSDLKFIKSRKVAQVVIEVPIEQAGAFVSAFGTPQPDKETWVAIARLEAAETADKPKGGRLAKKAGILCATQSFQNYLYSAHPADWLHNIERHQQTSDAAAALLRSLCCVESRKAFDNDPVAGELFNGILNSYEAWKRGLAA